MEKISVTSIVAVMLLTVIFTILILFDPFPQFKDLWSEKILEESESIQIYIYDWPENLTNCWPKNFQHRRLSFEKHFSRNNFQGNLIDEEKSLFHTHQYSLYQILIQRLKHSPYYTTNPEKATHFFIPYDIGMCSSTRESDGALVATNCTKLPEILHLLKQSKYFQRRAGSNHILILSINHMMLHFLNQDCQSIFEECINCIKFGIDYYTHLLYPELKKLPHLSKNWISVPFPSNYHVIESKSSNLPWKRKDGSRKYPFCYLGSPEVTARKQKALRTKIIEFCEKYSQECYFNPLPSHSSNVNYFQLSNVTSSQIVTIRSEKRRKLQLLNPYDNCQFCFTPGGDFPTRKAFFDAILSGCIPIVFQLESAHFQWPYHWMNRANAYNSVLYYSRERFMTQSLEENYKLLQKYSKNPNFIKTKLETITEIGNRFQYNNLPNEIITKNKKFKPQEKDAFEVIIDILQMKRSLD